MNGRRWLADAVDDLLPQTQCGQCGFDGCRPYAEAIAKDSTEINQCPPGGDETIAELAALLGRPSLPLNTAHGIASAPAVARIDEAACIGCTLCIDACPVDAIVGARRLMHTVIAADCTGCALCLPPCPVDCIALVPTGAPRDRAAQRLDAPRLRERYRRRRQRLHDREQQARGKAAAAAAERKKTVIARALERARKRLADRKS
jgi:electron transport complex protein RnfB